MDQKAITWIDRYTATPGSRVALNISAVGQATINGADGATFAPQILRAEWRQPTASGEWVVDSILIVTLGEDGKVETFERSDFEAPGMPAWVDDLIEANTPGRISGPIGDYEYDYKDPRGILAGQRWEDLVGSQIVSVRAPLVGSGFVGISIGSTSVTLHAEVAEEMHEALGYARHRAAGQSCPDCGNPGEPVKSGSSMWSCINGHTWDTEIVMDMIRPCMACGGYGNY